MMQNNSLWLRPRASLNMDEINGVPDLLQVTPERCLAPSSRATSASPSSSPRRMTSTSGRSVQDRIALRCMTAICGSVKGFGAEKRVIKGMVNVYNFPTFRRPKAAGQRSKMRVLLPQRCSLCKGAFPVKVFACTGFFSVLPAEANGLIFQRSMIDILERLMPHASIDFHQSGFIVNEIKNIFPRKVISAVKA